MASFISPYYPQSECVASFEFQVPLACYTGVFFQPATLNQCRFSWTSPDGTKHKTEWFSTALEVCNFASPSWASSFLMEVTSLSPCLEEPTEWTDLQLMPLKNLSGISPQTSKPQKDAYQTTVEKPLKNPLPLKPLVNPPSYAVQEVYWSEGEGYISPNGTRISYSELSQLNAGSLVRKSDIDFQGEPQAVSSLLPTAQNIAYWCGFKDIQFLTD
jgi:hypothetical protein